MFYGLNPDQKELTMTEQAMVWITAIGMVIIPLIGWLFKVLFARDIEDIKRQQKEDKELFFRKLDEDRLEAQIQFVRRDIYEQAMRFNHDGLDAKFESIQEKLDGIRTQMEDKIGDIKELETKIDDIKKMIDKKQ